MFLKEKSSHIHLYITLPLIVTTLIWMWSKVEIADTLTWVETPRYLSQILSLFGVVLLAVSYLMVSRVRFMEKVFGGLDKVYKNHSLISKVAFVFILAHPLLLIPQFLMTGENVWSLFVPGIDTWAKTAGITALYGYIILIALAMSKKIPYHIWKHIHSLMGVPFIIAAYHVFNASSDVARFVPLQFWMGLCFVVGVGSYVYKTLLYEYIGPKFEYEVIRNKLVMDGVYELVLRPVKTKINFEPGEFAFISVPGHAEIPKEHHPFSISSSPGSNELRFVYKVFGDYTEKLTRLEEGKVINIFGPYGEFTSHMYDFHKKQIWIGAGVGVTPFLSMLHHESQNDDRKNIKFYHCVKSEDELIYDGEINELAQKADDNFTYRKHFSVNEGYLTGDLLEKEVGKDLSEYAVMMCGPNKMMISLKADLMKRGVPEDQIYYEEFGFS